MTFIPTRGRYRQKGLVGFILLRLVRQQEHRHWRYFLLARSTHRFRLRLIGARFFNEAN